MPTRPILRMLTKVSSLVIVCLLYPSSVHAAPAPRPGAGAVCDPHAISGRRLPRHPRSFGGPLKPPSRHALVGLIDPGARLLRATRANLNDDDAAIQNDTPAARMDADGRPEPALQRLGQLIRPIDRRPKTRAFSPKSPRGPPVAA